MLNRDLSLDDATKVWWAWAWRTVVVAIPLHLIVAFGLRAIDVQTYGAQDWILLIIDLAVSIYFLRTAINGKNYGDFRVAAVEDGGSKQQVS